MIYISLELVIMKQQHDTIKIINATAHWQLVTCLVEKTRVWISSTRMLPHWATIDVIPFTQNHIVSTDNIWTLSNTHTQNTLLEYLANLSQATVMHLHMVLKFPQTVRPSLSSALLDYKSTIYRLSGCYHLTWYMLNFYWLCCLCVMQIILLVIACSTDPSRLPGSTCMTTNYWSGKTSEKRTTNCKTAAEVGRHGWSSNPGYIQNMIYTERLINKDKGYGPTKGVDNV